MTPAPQRPSTPAAHVGMGYLHSLISEDEAVRQDYEHAFTSTELLAAVAAPVQRMARYLGYHLGLSVTEVADRLLAGHLAAVDLPPNVTPLEN